MNKSLVGMLAAVAITACFAPVSEFNPDAGAVDGGTTDGGIDGVGGGTGGGLAGGTGGGLAGGSGGGLAGGTGGGGAGGGAGGGGGSMSGCGPQTCATGCCVQRICLPRTLQSRLNCGTNGQVCAQCPMGQACTNGVCGSPQPEPDGGVGAACIGDVDCQASSTPAAAGACFPQTLLGQPTGWTGGYCTRKCAGATQPCGDGASCVNISQDGGSDFACFRSCEAPRMGQSSCRPDYLCEINPLFNNLTGICIPRCTTPGFRCPNNAACNPSTGYCAFGGP